MSRKSTDESTISRKVVHAILAASVVSVLLSSTAFAGHGSFRAPTFRRASAPAHVTGPLAKIRPRGGPANAANLQIRWPTWHRPPTAGNGFIGNGALSDTVVGSGTLVTRAKANPNGDPNTDPVSPNSVQPDPGASPNPNTGCDSGAPFGCDPGDSLPDTPATDLGSPATLGAIVLNWPNLVNVMRPHGVGSRNGTGGGNSCEGSNGGEPKHGGC